MAQQPSYNELINSPKNWTIDFKHENGKYMNQCLACDSYFLGYKRRLICYECADHSEEPKEQLKINSNKAG